MQVRPASAAAAALAPGFGSASAAQLVSAMHAAAAAGRHGRRATPGPRHDPAFTPAVLAEWRKTLPDAPVTQLDDASHYIQEDAHERIVPQLLSLLAGASA